MKTRISLVIISLLIFSCKEQHPNSTNLEPISNVKISIDSILEVWHKAAADADFEKYFGYMTGEAIFIGTDATENWSYEDFKKFSKPYFDKGKAWNFKTLERNIFVHESQNIAWFDELLDTQMKICRGSGVLTKVDDKWKIAHYVLSITVPNDDVSELIEIKKDTDSILIQKIKNNSPK